MNAYASDPHNSTAEAELNAAIAACSAKHFKTSDLLRQCVQTRLGS